MRISMGHHAVPVVRGVDFVPAPVASCGWRRSRVPLRLRLNVLMLRARLDREIAAEAPRPSADRALALRARQLTARRTRRRVARELRRIVEYADRHGSSPVISCVIVERAAVRQGREAVLGLAERLESDAPVNAAGVVLARALLTDAISPLHNPYSPRTVNEAIFEVQDALATHAASEFAALAG
jgi:hypothetical protein